MEDLGSEIVYSFSRSGGKGGQHVNKVETKVQLRFNIKESNVLNSADKAILLKKLGSRISTSGVLLLSSQHTRSQLKNKEMVTKQLYQLLTVALIPVKERKKGKIPVSIKRKRPKR